MSYRVRGAAVSLKDWDRKIGPASLDAAEESGQELAKSAVRPVRGGPKTAVWTTARLEKKFDRLGDTAGDIQSAARSYVLFFNRCNSLGASTADHPPRLVANVSCGFALSDHRCCRQLCTRRFVSKDMGGSPIIQFIHDGTGRGRHIRYHRIQRYTRWDAAMTRHPGSGANRVHASC
jgi:hypothetical protein